MKIRSRLTLNFLFTVSAIILLICVGIYVTAYFYTKQNFEDRLYAKALSTTVLLMKVQEIDSALLKTIDKAQQDLSLNEKVVVYNDSGIEIYTNNDVFELEIPESRIQEIKNRKAIRFTQGDYTVMGLYYTDPYNRVVAIAAGINEQGRELLYRLSVVLYFSFLFSIIVVAVTGWLFVGRALKPMSSIINKVATLSPVERSERLPVNRENDEISSLVKTFNGLFDKLEDSFRLQKNFVANVSHELNNPLTKIKSQIQVSMMQHKGNPEYYRLLDSILEDVDDLTALLQDLLQFSKLSSQNQIPRAPFRIDELLFEVRDTLLQQNPGHSIQLRFSNAPANDEQLLFTGNKALITVALKNIIDNACKFSPDHTAIVSLDAADGLKVLVSDNGPGIPAGDLPHIFEPFYRSPSMESVKGYGVGLALAQRIFMAHNLKINVQSVEKQGTTFLLIFR